MDPCSLKLGEEKLKQNGCRTPDHPGWNPYLLLQEIGDLIAEKKFTALEGISLDHIASAMTMNECPRDQQELLDVYRDLYAELQVAFDVEHEAGYAQEENYDSN